ncbi:MAG: FAD-dependent oxidoreductase [Lentisphaerae bacterium]|nr:FAD-dependent oxidoreductase [Lentisphaerota bacterium]
MLIEQAPTLGGTMVRAGVGNWEPGVGGTGIPFDLYRRMKRIPDAVGITRFGRHAGRTPPGAPRFPGGELILDSAHAYRDTLCRHGAPGGRWDYDYGRTHWHGVVFEPEAMRHVVEAALAETGRCRVLTRMTFSQVVVREGRLDALLLTDGACVRAPVFVDATGDAALAQACGCPTACGEDAQATYGEPSAPERATPRANGVTLVYRIALDAETPHSPIPSDVPDACWWRPDFPDAVYTQHPCGDFSVNMLPTMEGAEFLSQPPEAAYEECRRRVMAHWRDSQRRFSEFRRCRLAWIAPALGIRETRRIVGECVLTEHDVRAGLRGQTHADIVAIADHPFDTHGRDSAGCRELAFPYGVPFRCLLPRGIDNLLVASRASSFSALAASSCRLSRTMMQLGQAAGTAAALALDAGLPLRSLPPETLRDALRGQHVSLTWPMPEALASHLDREDAP